MYYHIYSIIYSIILFRAFHSLEESLALQIILQDTTTTNHFMISLILQRF